MIKIYHNPRCSKSREAIKLLEAKNVEFQVIHYLETPPTPTELLEILQRLGITASQLARQKEPIYKDLDLANQELSEEQWIETLIENPKLIERPIVVTDQQAMIGRPAERILEIV